MNVFDEKTICVLNLKELNDTALFVSFITKMWHILNIRSPHDGIKLNDEDRMPVTSSDDKRLKILCAIAVSQCLTPDTSNALHITLNGIVELIKTFLTKGLSYVLTSEFSSDLETTTWTLLPYIHASSAK